MAEYGDLTMRQMGDLPAHLTEDGQLLIGGQTFSHPIAENSISVSRERGHPFNRITLTILVGEVTMDVPKRSGGARWPDREGPR